MTTEASENSPFFPIEDPQYQGNPPNRRFWTIFTIVSLVAIVGVITTALIYAYVEKKEIPIPEGFIPKEDIKWKMDLTELLDKNGGLRVPYLDIMSLSSSEFLISNDVEVDFANLGYTTIGNLPYHTDYPQTSSEIKFQGSYIVPITKTNGFIRYQDNSIVSCQLTNYNNISISRSSQQSVEFIIGITYKYPSMKQIWGQLIDIIPLEEIQGLHKLVYQKETANGVNLATIINNRWK